VLAIRYRKAVSAETRKRYAKATKKEKNIILNQFTKVTGYNRGYVSYILSIKKEKVLGCMTTSGRQENKICCREKKKKRVKVRIYICAVIFKT